MMKAKNHILALAAAAAVAVCFAGCGNDDSSSKSGSVSLTTTTTTAAQDASTPEESKADESKADESKNDESKNDESKNDESKSDSSETAAPSGDIKTKAKLVYNGFEFGVGDNLNDIKDKLGSEAGPSQKVESCMTGKPEVVYYFKNINVHTSTEGVIYSVDMGMDALFEGEDGQTKDGVKVGMTFDEAKKLLGEPTKTDSYNYFYEDGTLRLQLAASLDDDSKVGAISVTDPSFNS